MAISTFDGPIRSKGGMYNQGPATVVNLANGTNTKTLTVAEHAGRIITTNDATLVITLPSISAAADSSAAGPGADPNNPNTQGAVFYIYVETAATALNIGTDGTDKYVGSILIVATDASGATTGYAPGASNDFINMNGTTKGGAAGSWIRITALKSLQYLVEGILLGSSTIATPFADS